MDSICVFCGSRDGNNPAYLEAARETGAAIARRGWRLVFGGGHVGIMGALADAALAQGGEVVGVIPRALLAREIAHPDISQLHVVTSMHRRKALMSSLSDGFLSLPGGFGTLEEFFETLTWAQLGMHDKPCALLDVAGFWDPLLAMLAASAAEGFVTADHLELILADTNIDALLDRMAAYTPPHIERSGADPRMDASPLQTPLLPDAAATGEEVRPRSEAHRA